MWAEGKHGSATTGGHIQPTQGILLEYLSLVTRKHCAIGHHRTLLHKVMKILTELEKKVNELMRTSTKRKYKTEPARNEELNN